MNIEIISHKELVQRAFKHTPKNLIFISSPVNSFIVERSQEAVDKVPHKLLLLFDDVCGDALGDKRHPNMPMKAHTSDAISFAEGLDDLVVSCQAGISRSAAIAFSIVAGREGVLAAFQILNPLRHSPNPLIISHAQELLNLPFLNEMMVSWKKGDQKEFNYFFAEHTGGLERRAKLFKL